MNWYKVAKLIDKNFSHSKDKKIYVKCSVCGKYATHPSSPVASDDEYVWKSLDELNSEEINEAIRSEKPIKDRDPNLSISHGHCPICFQKAMENIH